MAEETRALLPQCYAKCAKASRDYACAQHAKLAAALRQNGHEPPPLSAFLEAFAHVRARSVEVSDELAANEPRSELLLAGSGRRRALLPAFDLLNHKHGTSTELTRGEGGDWVVHSGDAYRAGEQCHVSYGDSRDNLKMLLQYGFALEPGEEQTQLVIFDVADLIDGCVAARPRVFADVRDEMMQALEVTHASDSAPAASAHQQLSLFTFDGASGLPRESLQTALGMLEGVAEALDDGSSAEDSSDDVKGDIMRAMLKARLHEVSGKLDDIARLPGRGQAAGSRPPMLEAVGSLLRAESAVLAQLELA